MKNKELKEKLLKEYAENKYKDLKDSKAVKWLATIIKKYQKDAV